MIHCVNQNLEKESDVIKIRLSALLANCLATAHVTMQIRLNRRSEHKRADADSGLRFLAQTWRFAGNEVSRSVYIG